MELARENYNVITIRDDQVLLVEKQTGELLWVPNMPKVQHLFGLAEVSKNKENQGNEGEEPQQVGDDKIWTKENTICLINLVEEHETHFDHQLKKNVWLQIADRCSKQFKKEVTFLQVESKWKSLKRTYKSVLLHNNRTGQRRRRWEFFDIIHRFMHKMPEITPPATCSTSAGLTVNTSGTEQGSSEQEEANVESSFAKKKKIRESEASKRHKEKMAKLDRFNDLFEKMVEKM